MSERRLPWFPCFPSKLLGAFSAMEPNEGYLYWIVCLRIYEVNGPCPDTDEALARRTGLTRGKVSDALTRLLKSGKLVRGDGGIINPFAAGVIADRETVRNKLKNAGKLGAEKRHQKTPQNQRITPGEAKASAEQGLGILTSTPTVTEEEKTASKSLGRWPSDCRELFWSAYPIKKGKAAAMAKLEVIRKRGDVPFETLMAGVARYVASRPEPRYTKHPATWLNQGCWDDEHNSSPRGNGPNGQPSFGDIAGGNY